MAFHGGRIFQGARIFKIGLLLIAALAAILLVVSTSDARSPWPSSSSSYGVTLEDEQGNPLGTYRQAGTTFVLGSVGERYNVRIQNYTDRRVEAVVSIDGRDAVSGRSADFVRERGYIIPAYGSVVIDGFRKSLAESAAFRFSSPPDSYSSRMGTPENVGVVGVAFFPEQRRVRPAPVRPVRPVRPVSPWREGREDRDDLYGFDSRTSQAPTDKSPRAEARRAAPAPSSPSASAPAAKGRASAATEGAADERASRLGTEYGESRYSPVSEVAFQRNYMASPTAVLTLRYDDVDGLLARGIDVYPRRYWDEPRAATPEAFPGNRFAPAPPYRY